MEVLNKEKVLEHAKQLIEEGKLDRAITEYRKLLDIDPKDMRIRIRVAELLARQKKVSDAVKVYKEVADSYTGDGFYLKAVTVYKNVLRLNPALIDINYRLAELYEKMGLAKDATHQYQILSHSLEQKGNFEALVDVRRKMVALDPHNIANRIRLAETYQYQGREEESLNEYEGLIEEVRESGQTDKLIDLYEKVLSYRPDNLEMVRSLSEIYYKRGEWKRVVALMEKAGKLVEEETDLILMQADVYARLNQFETAKNKYKAAAEIFTEAGSVDQALEAYKEALVIVPDDEEEIKELVDEIDDDCFEQIKADADEKRKILEERAAEIARREEEGELTEDSPEGEVADKDEEARAARRMPAIVKLTDDEIRIKLRDADAAFELGKAYQQMGLPDEARPELEKSDQFYRELERAQAEDPIISKRIVQIEQWLGSRAVPEEIDEKVEEAPKEKVAVKTKAEKKETPKDSLKGKEEETVAPVKAKKKKKKAKDEGDAKTKKKKNRMGFV